MNLVKDEDGVLDIGRCDRVMDGRPLRAEMWAQDGVSALTIFFSTVGLDQADEAAAVQLALSERLATMRPEAEGSDFCEGLDQRRRSLRVVCQRGRG